VAHDIVLYDQRGTGLAQPSLECPDVDEVKVANLQRSEPYAVELGAVLVATAACRERLTATGVDFDDYDTEASVRDLEAIRAAFGYDEWNIIGSAMGPGWRSLRCVRHPTASALPCSTRSRT
jgi:pimeloyl-ACP methyl ester carboxylesterase